MPAPTGIIIFEFLAGIFYIYREKALHIRDKRLALHQ